jgi:hypothetical protein
MAENGSLMGKVERIIRAQASRDAETDGDEFIVSVKRLARGRVRAAARLQDGHGNRYPMSEVTADLVHHDGPKPTFDEVEIALLGAAMTEVRKRRAALEAAVEE